MNDWRDKINIKWIAWGGGAFVVIIVLISILANLLKTNPYGPEIVIDDFDKYFSGVSEDRRYLVQSSLYNIVHDNFKGNESVIQASRGVIRDGSAESNYDEENAVWAGSFIVDVEAMKQSYKGSFEWTKDGQTASGGGYVAVFTCLKPDQLVYGDFECWDMFSNDISTKFPITTKLPLLVSEYSNNYTKYVNYNISYTINDDNDGVTINIKDYEGNGREHAYAKIRELGFNPDDYVIEYQNVSSEYQMNYVGDD